MVHPNEIPIIKRRIAQLENQIESLDESIAKSDALLADSQFPSTEFYGLRSDVSDLRFERDLLTSHLLSWKELLH